MTIKFEGPNFISVLENPTGVILDIQASLQGGAADDGVSYSIDGDDAVNFFIDSNTGKLNFKSVADFEDPRDHDGDNDYDLRVVATSHDDVTISESQNLIIRVTDVPDNYAASYNLGSLLDGSNGFVVEGFGESTYGGNSVSNGGDINGDGFDDVLIEALNTKETYVVFGFQTDSIKPSVIDITALNGTNGFSLLSADETVASGGIVSSAGDINGDGYDDIIIGVAARNNLALLAPRVSNAAYVFFGRKQGAFHDGELSLGELSLKDLDGDHGFAIIDLDGDLGISVSGAGDINGDGFDDIIIGASDVNSATGETYVVFGFDDPETVVINRESLNDFGFTLIGNNNNDKSGWSVSGAGDINGDGFDDVIIGAPGAKETYVVFGGGDDIGNIDLNSFSADEGVTLTSVFGNGYSVASAGDVNGDGYDDLVVGAKEYFSYANTSYVVFGGANLSSNINLATLDGNNGFALPVIENGDVSRNFVSSAGDFNGDGYDDIIIGAYHVNSDTGASYVVFGFNNDSANGGVSISSIALSSLDGSNGFKLSGTNNNDFSGWSVSGAGDINGDGYSDVIIGAIGIDNLYGINAPEFNISASYIVYGGNGLLSADITYPRYEGPVSNDHSTKLTSDLTENQTVPTSFDDFLEYGYDADLVKALSGGDYVDGGNGNDTINGGDGDDTIEGGNGDDLLLGGDGDDFIYVGFKSGHFPDHGSNNTVWAGIGHDIVVGGAGDDTIGGGGGDDNVIGGHGNDLMFGGEHQDTLMGGRGFDTLYGGEGEDWMQGGAHADVLRGGAGDDSMEGGTSDDTLWGDAGNDTLFGGDGNDTLWGGAGNDTLLGGDGSDTIGGGDGDDSVISGHIAFGGDGNDTLFGGSHNDTLWGGTGNDIVVGGDGYDTIGGGYGDDSVIGGHGNDIVFGGDGNDTLFGGGYNDILWGGAGNDQLTGGTGNDIFAFTLGSGHDHVTDFDMNNDILDLSETDFVDLNALISASNQTDAGLLVTINANKTFLLTGLEFVDLIEVNIIFGT